MPKLIGKQTLQFTLEIAQATHEVSLLLAMINLLGSGYIKPKFDFPSLEAALAARSVSRLILRKNQINPLIDFMIKNPLLTTKNLDFLD